MNIHIAGGVGERSRSCFYLSTQDMALLVDCGLQAAQPVQYPNLSDQQAGSARYLLLTHSHPDHAGGIPWLLARGFEGQIIASAETFDQLPCPIKNKRVIEPGQTLRLDEGLQVTCGRSGHCIGALWYEISLAGKQLLFSGDYSEDSLLYACDKLRGRWADVAFLDNGRDQALGSAESLQLQLRDAVRKALAQGQAVILPVPQQGRALEMMQLLRGLGQLRLDEACQQVRDSVPLHSQWFKAPMAEGSGSGGGIYFIADSQLKQPGNRVLVDRLMLEGAQVILTGYAEPDSFAAKLLRLERARQIIYPSHQADRGLELLSQLNSFGRVVPCHSERFSKPGDINL